MVLKKCHFDNLFKKILEKIETEFDKDFELEVFYDLEGETDMDIEELVSEHAEELKNELWDINYQNHPRNLAERLIKKQIVFLLYLYKKLMEEQ